MGKNISLIGMGCGPFCVTAAGMMAIDSAELIIGSDRMLALLPGVSARRVTEFHSDEIYKIIMEAFEEKIAVLYSGDVGLYSGAPGLLDLLKESAGDIRAQMIPGVSVLQFLASRIGFLWQDVRVVSAHGREYDPVAAVSDGNDVLFLTESCESLHEICGRLSDAGFSDRKVVVAERLGYEDEKITFCLVSEARELKADDLNVLLVEGSLS